MALAVKQIESALVPLMITRVLPAVEKELGHWQRILTHCPDQKLADLALSSIHSKRFHAQGGSVFSIYHKGSTSKLVPPIVALQTISDYLDNLCDRAGCLDGRAFRQLHFAFEEALEPWQSTCSPYYEDYPHKDDGGYLTALVHRCRGQLADLPSYQGIKNKAMELARHYTDLQVYKHVHPQKREALLEKWFYGYRQYYPELAWWEFAAASGSTLGIFMLFALASEHSPGSRAVNKVARAYFPWIGGLHILLDYFIDQEEDHHAGDLNFVSYYAKCEEYRKRLHFFLQKALAEAGSLPRPSFHLTVIKGLLALYLSDTKVQRQGLQDVARELLQTAGKEALLMYRLCCLLRNKGEI